MNSHEIIELKRNPDRVHHGPSMQNNKPYRTKALKELAANNAVKVRGLWMSNIDICFHPVKRGQS